MSKVFDYISGKVEGREAELEAALEHLMAYCVPEPEYERQQAENAKLRAALEEISSCVQLLGLDGWSDAPHVMKVIAAALNEETK